jgi:hypothetical protein
LIATAIAARIAMNLRRTEVGCNDLPTAGLNWFRRDRVRPIASTGGFSG